ncbi:MAG: hypothetical protein WKG00_01440 [Polyangiaceae bacterium]
MLRRIPPPDFRYVSLIPGPTSASRVVAGGTVGVTAASLGLWSAAHDPLSVAVTLGVGAGLTWALSRAGRPARRGAREVTMAIVPWGVIVQPETEPRVLRWAAVRRVDVEQVTTMHGGTPAVTSSLVTVETEREILAGRTAGSANLERLVVDLQGYAEEAARAVALDLEATEAAGDGATEPVVAALLDAARDLCTTSRGVCRLSLPSAGYRTVATPVAAPETTSLLRAVLRAGAMHDDTGDPGAESAPSGAAPEGGSAQGPDPRALAALVASMVDARDLVPDLLRLVSSPHPVVAGAARAAALRLGAPQSRAGAVEEVEEFLFDEDASLLRAWAAGGAALS